MGDPFAQLNPVAPALAPAATPDPTSSPPPISPPVVSPAAGGAAPDIGSTLTPAGAPAASVASAPENPIDTLGRLLFGQNNGSALGGVPGVGDIGRNIGPAFSYQMHNALSLAVSPLTAAGDVLSHMPTGWVPGGADQQFQALGDWQKVNDPAGYAKWQVANAAANADVLGGGNTKADYTRQWGVDYANQTKEGVTGIFATNPGLAMSPAGSVGGALMDALGIAGLAGGTAQNILGGTSIFGGGKDQNAANAPQVTRVQQIMDRASTGQELNPIEQQVATHMQDGSWSEEHARNFLVANGQGMFRDFIPQMVASVATDPMTWAMGGGAAALKLGKMGEEVNAAGQGAQTALEHLAVATKAVASSPAAPVFKIVRSIYDPFSILPSTGPLANTVDLMAGGATKSLDGIYGPQSMANLFKTASTHGFTTELQSALGTYATNLARQFTVTAFRATEMLKDTGSEMLARIVPDSVVNDLMRIQPNDVITRLTDYGYGFRKVFGGNAVADDANLVGRLISEFPSNPDWAGTVAKMGDEEKSAWHAVTFSKTEISFDQALREVTGYKGSLPLDRLVVLNDNKLDNVAAQIVHADVAAAEGPTAKAATWNAAAAKYSEISDLGRAEASTLHAEQLNAELEKLIASGGLHTRALPDELADPALKPLQDFLDTHTINGQALWNVGFAPDAIHAFGFARDARTGLLRISSAPFVSHVIDAVPAGRPVSDLARNFMGQIIGPVAASKLAKPVEAMEVSIKTAQDVITGQRLLMNMEQRFGVNMTKLGMSGRDARRLFRAARDAAQLQHTTIQGLHPENVWKAVQDIIPPEMKGALTQNQIMVNLLDASGGDLRIMGLTSGYTQRVRTALARAGLPNNYAGEATVNFYRMVRYSLNPLFYIQRVTDGIYFNIMKGVAPVWTGRALEEGSPLWEAEQLSARLGETGLARDASMDMPEYQLRSNFQEALRTKFGEVSKGRIEGLANAGSRWQLNNMASNFSSHLGDIVTESLAEARAPFEKMLTDPNLSALDKQSIQNALDGMTEWSDIASHYSAAAGRTLSPSEIGLKYIQEQFHDSLGQRLTADGMLQYREDIKTGVYHTPTSVGQIQPLGLRNLATDLGYVKNGEPDVAALQRAISPGAANTGEAQRSVEWLRERLKDDFSADPSYVKRAVYALTFNSNHFWGDARAALDLSPQEASQLQGVIAREAISREMTPNEYLSQVLRTTLGPIDPTDHLGKLLEVIKGGFVGSERSQINKLTNIFIGTLDPSGQRTILENYVANLPDLIQKAAASGDAEQEAALRGIQATLGKGPASDFARFGTDARANSTVPSVFKSEPGYVYRTVDQGRVASDWRPGEYAAKHPATIYANGDQSVVLRTKQGDLFDQATSGVNAADNVTARAAIPASDVEVLRADGTWGPAVDPFHAAQSSAFADLVARRAAGEAINNPDVEAIVRAFSKWTKSTVAASLTDSRGWVGKLANELSSKIPVDGAYTYNRSEALVEQLMRQKIVLAQRDAYRLAEMSTQRTMFGRTLNHPVWGLYPSSYMWGKVLPEMVKFLAKSPFGFESGIAGYELARVEQAIAIRREYDPQMATAADALANSPTTFLLDYLTPSLPGSDMRAATPPWAQAMAKSGLDLGAIAKAEFATISPTRWTNQIGKAGSETIGAVKGALKPQPSAQPTGAPGALQNLVDQPTPTVAAPATSGPIQELTAPLASATQQLRDLLTKAGQ